MPAKIIFVRHGETPHNSDGKLIGWRTDIPLSDDGRQDALRSAAKLRHYKIDIIYHSDMLRTTETAHIISAELGLTTTAEQLLRERDLGEFDGHSLAELKAKNPEWVERFFDHADCSWCTPGGESLSSVHIRFRKLINKLHNQHPDKTVLLVTHSGFIHTVLRDIYGFFPIESFIEVAHDAVTVLEKDGASYRLIAHNQ